MKGLLLVLAVVAAVPLLACFDDDGSGNGEDLEPRILFVQNARTAELTQSGDDNEYRLTLHGVDAATLWFTDRPVHKAGTEPTAEMLHDILGDAGAGPPNAAMVWADEDGETTLVMELLSADYDAEQGGIVYQARLLQQADGHLAEFGESATVPSGAISDPALFIDSILKKEVCELDIYNRLQILPVSSGDPTSLIVRTIPDDQTDTVYGPPGGELLEPGDKFSWKWTASSLTNDCGVEVNVYPKVTGTVVNPDADFSMRNPSRSGNTFTMGWCVEAHCSWVYVTDATTFHMAFILCEQGVSDATCKQRAGF